MKPQDLQTRSDWEKLALDYWHKALPHVRECPGRWKLSYHPGHHTRRGAEMEGWSRQLWALVPLLAGGSTVPEFDVILEGITAGVDPDSPHFWGAFSDHDQRMVESAVLGAALRMCPEHFWKPLSDRTQQQLVEFLNQINRFKTADNNWLFFRVLVNCGLQHIGADYPVKVQEDSLLRIESFLQEDPWYSDGPTGAIDYYNPMGFHFYGLLYSIWQQDTDPQRAQLWQARSHRCAEAFVHWFDNAGAALPYGRSLTYRYAQGSLWSALAWAGGGPFDDSVLKGLLGRHMAWWQNLPIHAADGTLTRGYGYPQDAMTEVYNSLGSPYWGFKIFWMLALPEQHPFWQAPAAPHPETSVATHSLRPARMLLSATKTRSHVVAVSAGLPHLSSFVRHAAEKYGKMAYSSQLAFAVPVGREPWSALAPDNSLMLRRTSDEHWYVRAVTTDFTYGPNWVQSVWQPCPSARIQTRIEVHKGIQTRHHTLWLEEVCDVTEGGFAIPSEPPPRAETTAHHLRLTGEVWASGMEILSGQSKLTQVELSTGSHLMFPKACLPVRSAILEPGTHHWSTRVYAELIDQEGPVANP